MEAQKEELIRDSHVIQVEVKTKNKYEFGGRVEGRATSTYFAGCFGTIVDAVDPEAKLYLIQWDDNSTTEAQ